MGLFNRKSASSYQLFSKAARRSKAGNGFFARAYKHSVSATKRNARRKRGIFKGK